MRRLYATKFDTRGSISFVRFRWEVHLLYDDDDVRVIPDVTDDTSIIFLITSDATTYELLKFGYDSVAGRRQIVWDYFNPNIPRSNGES